MKHITILLAAFVMVCLSACSGNSRSSSESSPTPAESANSVGGMATAAANAVSGAAAGAKNAMAGAAAGAAHMANGAAGAMNKMAPGTKSFALKAQHGSGESGKVTLVGTGEKTTVTISLDGENTTGKQPAHIHVGPCSTLGAVKYPLSDVVLGKSVTIVAAPIDALTSGTLAVNVHESAADISKYVACADLTKANAL